MAGIFDTGIFDTGIFDHEEAAGGDCLFDTGIFDTGIFDHCDDGAVVRSKGFAGWSQPYEDEGHRRRYEREKRSREQELRRSIERAYAELTGEKEQAKQFPTPVTTAAIARIIKQEPDYRRFEIQTDRLQALIGMYIEEMERQAQAEAIRLDDEVAALLLLTAI
jgi:hypothetical protein